jgi:hypothetical protein
MHDGAVPPRRLLSLLLASQAPSAKPIIARETAHTWEVMMNLLDMDRILTVPSSLTESTGFESALNHLWRVEVNTAACKRD